MKRTATPFGRGNTKYAIFKLASQLGWKPELMTFKSAILGVSAYWRFIRERDGKIGGNYRKKLKSLSGQYDFSKVCRKKD